MKDMIVCCMIGEMCALCLTADIVALAAAVTELLNHTRRARTALWCAVQMTSAECAGVPLLTDNTSHDPVACRHGTSLVTDNWHSPVSTTQPLNAVPQK